MLHLETLVYPDEGQKKKNLHVEVKTSRGRNVKMDRRITCKNKDSGGGGKNVMKSTKWSSRRNRTGFRDHSEGMKKGCRNTDPTTWRRGTTKKGCKPPCSRTHGGLRPPHGETLNTDRRSNVGKHGPVRGRKTKETCSERIGTPLGRHHGE